MDGGGDKNEILFLPPLLFFNGECLPDLGSRIDEFLRFSLGVLNYRFNMVTSKFFLPCQGDNQHVSPFLGVSFQLLW